MGDLTFYLGTPGNPLQAHAASGMPVLISYAAYLKIGKWQNEYVPTYSHLLLDSGAFSELNSGVKVDLDAYLDWKDRYPFACAWAGLDDIKDWRRSMKNYERGGFPTIHEEDPLELLDELIPMARERQGWIGVGLTPPRTKTKEPWVRKVLNQMPDDLHVHGWACGQYAHLPRWDSLDSTNWFRDVAKVRNSFPWLTSGEALEIIVKRYQRAERTVVVEDTQLSLPVARP